MVKYFITTKTKTTGKLKQWSINAKNKTNAKKRFSKRKYIVLDVKRSRG